MWRPLYGSRCAGRRRHDQSRSTEPQPRAKSCRSHAPAYKRNGSVRSWLTQPGSPTGLSRSQSGCAGQCLAARRRSPHRTQPDRSATTATGRSWRPLRALRASLALERPGREPERLLSLAAEGPKANVQVALGLVVAVPLGARENEAPLLGLRNEGRRIVLRPRKPTGHQGAQTYERRHAQRNSQQLPDTRVPHLSPPLGLRLTSRHTSRL